MNDEMGTILQALVFAADRHRQQKRKDQETPYINHPLEVVELLWRVGGVRDTVTLTAAALHDTVEDTGTLPEELTAVFGEEICRVVMEVTDDKSLPKAERKRLQVEHSAHISHAAQQIKLADKICNLRDICTRPPVGWEAQRRTEYFHWAAAVAQGMRGANPALEAELDQLLEQGLK